MSKPYDDSDLPNVEQILIALQERYGKKLKVTPALIAKWEAAKASAPSEPENGCTETDICILCDTADICHTCDSMDWCHNVDVH
jgi:hypothetical protein